MEGKIKTYEKDDLVVYWDRSLCRHAGECVRGNKDIFDAHRIPWVNLDVADKEEIMKIIDRCPSGALSYKLKEK